jgi:hypothetical protein
MEIELAIGGKHRQLYEGKKFDVLGTNFLSKIWR